MKAFIQGMALLLGMGLLPGRAAAQEVTLEDEVPNSVMFISTNKAGNHIVRIMNDPKNKRFHDPSAPRFVLTDRKGKFALGIGGYVKATAEYDFGGISDNVDFYPSLIPNKGASSINNQFQMDVTTSTIFLKLVGRTNKLGEIVVYTAGNFRGDGKTFELQNAYASFLGFTAGYNYGLFMDLAALPPTIDFAGPNGQIFYRSTQFTYERSFGKRWQAGIGIEMPVVDGITTQNTSITTQRMPNFPAYIQYGWNSTSHVRLAGIVRSMTYENLRQQKAESQMGWGTFVSTTFNLCKKLQFYGQATCGRGIGQYLNDLSNLNVDIVPDPEKEGAMQALSMMGWYTGLQYNITPNVFVSGTYSQSRLYSDHDYPTTLSEQYRSGQYLVANLFWNITSDLQVGAEYLRGWRTDFNDQTRHANRLNLSAQYSF